MTELTEQVAHLFLLALPVACISWTITHEEIFKEPIDSCRQRSATCKSFLERKFFYLFTCEYCFSHYIAILLLCITKYHLLFNDWRGYFIGGFAIVWIANVYMSLHGFVRQCLKKEKLNAYLEEEKLKEIHKENDAEK